MARPDVFADFRRDHETAAIIRLEQNVGAEGHVLSAERDAVDSGGGCDGKIARIVEFAVIRQEALGHGTQDAAPMDGDGAIVKPGSDPKRRADEEQRQKTSGGLDNLCQRGFRRIEQGALMEEVIDRIAGQAHFGKQHDGRALVARLARQRQVGVRIGSGSVR